MSFPAHLALLVCSLAIVAIAGFLPFLNSTLPKRSRPKFPSWEVAIALIMLGQSTWSMLRLPLAQLPVAQALWFSAALVAGLGLKWMMEAIARKKPVIQEAVLFRALLAAPLMAALCPGIFGGRLTSGALLLWCLNGFFWQTAFSDLDRLWTKDAVIIRRREPPTLPYDFRKPEMPESD
jgi:hypothetical protein